MAQQRRVWVAGPLPFDTRIPAGGQVMVEVFLDGSIVDTVNVAFRPSEAAVWGPPLLAEEH